MVIFFIYRVPNSINMSSNWDVDDSKQQAQCTTLSNLDCSDTDKDTNCEYSRIVGNCTHSVLNMHSVAAEKVLSDQGMFQQYTV